GRVSPTSSGGTSERAVWSVSELSRRLAATLDERFPAVWVEGEISNFKVYGSGHAYFTLKDEGAQLRAVLFRNRVRRIRFEPADGLHVLAFGAVEIYAQRGEYQLVVELLEPRGLGALQLAFEQLKERLGREGLFDPARKRQLPRFPRKIGIVTSPSGAALHDMLRVIGRRLAAQRDRLETIRERRVLTDPRRPLRELSRRVDEATERLRRAMRATIQRIAHRVELATRDLRGRSPVARTRQDRRRLDDL